MSKEAAKRRLSETISNNRERSVWKYFLEIDSKKILVCREFLIKVLQITKRRLETIQTKLILNQNLYDNRGSHNSHTVKMDNKILMELDIFLKSFPSVRSHYSTTNKIYFLNSALNKTFLYNLFCDYYESKNNVKLSICRETFRNYFTTNFNYGFKKPRVDECDLCYKIKTLGIENVNQEDKLLYEIHMPKVKEYSHLRKKILEKNSKTLVLEFDYMANQPLPKIPNSAFYYRRNLYIYLFNVNVYSINASYIFHSIEGEAKKGANTIASYVNYVINELRSLLVNIDELETIYLLSDSAGGQNRNWCITKFCSLMAIILNINIIQVFPVRGHSYNPCDANFSQISREFKKFPTLEIPDSYLNIIKNKNGFQVIKTEVLDFTSHLDNYFKSDKKIKVSKSSRIDYYSNGEVSFSTNYEKSNNKVNLLIKKLENPNECLKHLSVDSKVAITLKKIKDVKFLLNFLTKDSKKFYNDYFNSTVISNENCEEFDESDLEY